MNEVKRRQINRQQRHERVRSKVSGSAEKPRLVVNVSNKNVSAQVIDDVSGVTIASSSTLSQKETKSMNLSEKSSWVGADVAKKAKSKKVKQVVFDRSYKDYHGRVKSVAEAARKEGLEF